jgi:hypothetical protein
MQPRVMHGHSDRVKLVSSVRPQSSRNDVGFVVGLCDRWRLINGCVGRRLSIIHKSILLRSDGRRMWHAWEGNRTEMP